MQLWRRGGGLIYNCKHQLFPGIDFNGKSMLEIGCSNGRYCVWASVNGASPVIGLEPLGHGSGSSQNAQYYFMNFVKSLKLKNINILPERIQDYECEDNYFDIVLMISSINHLDEESCINLKKSSGAKENYLSIFRKLNRIIKKGGELIVLESSNKNLFADLGFSVNPLNKKIAFKKHHEPEYWANLLSSCGFINAKISWLSKSRYRYLGFPLRNKVMAYLLATNFRLSMLCEK